MAKKIILDVYNKEIDRSGEEECGLCLEPIKATYYDFIGEQELNVIVCPKCFKGLPDD